jgi:CHASE3 domain sensor protein
VQDPPSRARIPIRTRVNLAFALAVVVLLAIAAASYQSVTSLAETGEWIGHTHEVLGAIDAVASATTTAEAGARGYALTGEERFLETYQAGARGAEVALAALRRLIADNPAEQGQVDRLEPLLREHLARLADTVAIRREQGGAAAADRVRAGSGTGLVESFHAAIEEMRGDWVRQESASRWRASPAGARPSRSTCLASRRRWRSPSPPGRPGAGCAARRRCSWWRATRACARSRARS